MGTSVNDRTPSPSASIHSPDGAGCGHRGQAVAQPVDVLGEATDQVDVGAGHVVDRQATAEVTVVVAAHRDAEQDPVEPRAPGVVVEAGHLERLARRAVDPPADAGLGDPPGDPGEIVVGETEPEPAGVLGRQVEDVGRGRPATGELDQGGRDGEQRVGAGQGPVGEPDPESVRRVPSAVSVVDHVGEPEPGRDQRREGLDVGAHHEDVAGLEGGVVVEQPDEHLAQHVDLAGRAVAGVHLQAVVSVARAAARNVRRRWGRGWCAGRAAASRAGCPARSTPGAVSDVGAAASSRRSSRVSRPSDASSG